MGKKLTRTVFVDDVAYGPASAIPAEVAARITNPTVWEDIDDESAPAGVVADTSGSAPGVGDVTVPDAESTVKELRDYAKATGVVLGTAKTKPEILAVLGLDSPAEDADTGSEPSPEQASAETETENTTDEDADTGAES